jgi:DNA polymerase-3 subunit chi
LGQTPPPDFERFERVIEVVDQEPETLTRSRERFRFYRERGFQPSSHKL